MTHKTDSKKFRKFSVGGKPKKTKIIYETPSGAIFTIIVFVVLAILFFK